jgi:uncharacterized protein (TIGR00297 family)
MRLLLGFVLAAIVAYIAYRGRSLDKSGMGAAIVVGTIVFGFGGWEWAVLLLAFFITSSGLTHAFKKRKTGLNEKFSKGGQRDAAQVFGNSGLAMLAAGLHYVFPHEARVWIAFSASLAAVNADTWATELGVLSPSPPRMIIDPRRVVEKGTSGGISLIGTLASLAGSALIAALAVVALPDDISSPLHGLLLLQITSAGMLGSLFDSLLGATVQAIHHCPVCNKETEHFPLHTCGARTKLKHGWWWLNNDLVNLGCAAFAVLIALVLQ